MEKYEIISKDTYIEITVIDDTYTIQKTKLH